MVSYCVTCGMALTNENARGLVCLKCFEANRANIHEKKRPPHIHVNFCLLCGEPLTPVENEVSHGECRGVIRANSW